MGAAEEISMATGPRQSFTSTLLLFRGRAPLETPSEPRSPVRRVPSQCVLEFGCGAVSDHMRILD
jgi:hypothetical protein